MVHSPHNFFSPSLLCYFYQFKCSTKGLINNNKPRTSLFNQQLTTPITINLIYICIIFPHSFFFGRQKWIESIAKRINTRREWETTNYSTKNLNIYISRYVTTNIQFITLFNFPLITCQYHLMKAFHFFKHF